MKCGVATESATQYNPDNSAVSATSAISLYEKAVPTMAPYADILLVEDERDIAAKAALIESGAPGGMARRSQ